MRTLEELTRPNVWRLKPYSSARDEYNGAAASVFLDANENPYNMPHNRYPDPMQRELKKELSKIKKVRPEHIFLGNGSDEAIDLVFRAFCEPRIDNVVAIDPTYGMYQVCAEVNDVEYRKVLLDENFQFSADMAFASQEVISILNKIKYPYNVNQLTQKQAIEMLHRYYEIERWVKTLKEERGNLEEEFAKLPCTVKMFPSDANFFLVRVTDAVRIYNYLVGEGIIVRNRNSVSLCGNCLRVTVGTRNENERLIEALRKYKV